ncbi:sigma-70, region 4 family [Treponema primitia ZAS-2]|uniref:Sigma-70, region 4 family n=1 Tax=Treponema primitia (strain ATCC BAA-887 / DSM 12427 / ZAS-2) TaxID=545694 RepID=F5YL73_TREPZ|nr:response regulator transcription factor [Treponema primitia]AEF86479.1 sigma-70, region 4 family [Treponema primitia ZAS-2]
MEQKDKDEYKRYRDALKRIGQKKTLVLIDSHTMFRELFVSWLIKTGERLWQTYDFSSGSEKLAALFEKKPPDYILLRMDFDMKEALDFLSLIEKQNTKARTVVYSDNTDYTHVRAAYYGSSGGFLSTNETTKDILHCFSAVEYGNKYIDVHNAQKMADAAEKVKSLLKKEQEVFTLVQQGFSNAEMAAQLGIGKHSVENYLSALYTKFGVENRKNLETL